ncbi:hypothetical protein FQ087_18640 [Sporosarcina sp. ANT_H38]|uniref:hypothetical protein n=1 Tax=Sporosarcina sp. ANT_H38 TaxID=2597358 RepID=UPI0011F2CA86|nr:hypothetical protein [Sporosarcina sp. ANT_H38]KAA0944143.1 hypothetical protein FQ087_18640 [Sporosarcina sp. ANT_H38]
MTESNKMDSVMLIAEKFVKHLESLERMVAYSDLIEKEYQTKKVNEKNLGEAADLIVHGKIIEHVNKIDPEKRSDRKEADNEVLELIEKLKAESDLIKYFHKNIEVSSIDDDITYTVKSPFVNRVLKSSADESFKLDSDINQLLNSIIISLATGMELLIADLFKDFIQNVDKSDFIEKKSLTYSELVKIGSVEEARIFLIDEYTEELLKKSFKYWLDEIERKLSIKVTSIEFLNQKIEKTFEVFQRRHLLIHNNGIVNSSYLSKVHPSLISNFKKDDIIEINNKYIEDSIGLFRMFGIVILFKYAEKLNRKEKDDMFTTLNDLLLMPSTRKCLGTRYIYKEVSEDMTYDHESRLIAQVNYYLTHKYNDDFEGIRSEVERFNVSQLSIEYHMAKNILLDKFDLALGNFKTFCTTIDEEHFLHVIDWPLLKLARKSDEFKDYINKRIHEIIKSEEDEKIEI